MPNARDAILSPLHKILVVGSGASGKTSLAWTLPGKKFAFLFDPAAIESIVGADIEYEEFLAGPGETDMTLKGFNKNAKPDDKPARAVEPKVFVNWERNWNEKVTDGYFDKNGIDWIIFDSITYLVSSMMDRQLWINNRFGGLEEQADYRVVGNKLTEVFKSITSMKKNLYCTGHLTTYQDEKTKKISTQLDMPGKSRRQIPLMFSNIWEARPTTEDKQEHVILTKSDPRGFQEIRSSLQGLKPVENVEIKDFNKPQDYGIGRLLREAKPRTSNPIGNRSSAPTASSATVPASGQAPAAITKT
jgi:hypothetical protein